jgi:hypothetical protein
MIQNDQTQTACSSTTETTATDVAAEATTLAETYRRVYLARSWRRTLDRVSAHAHARAHLSAAHGLPRR